MAVSGAGGSSRQAQGISLVLSSLKSLGFIYFPTASIVSLLYVMENSASAEIAIIGNEGLVRHLPVHGRREHAEPGGGAKRSQRLTAKASVLRREFALGGNLTVPAFERDGALRALSYRPLQQTFGQ
jgi:hypothetical protein